MLQVACVMRADGGQLEPRFVAGPDDGEDLEPELELFMDWDGLRVDGRGTYAQDDDECRSRRVDLRGPTDADPGPLPMEEAPEDITAKHLILRPSAP
ncbi:MAG: hypothetical protein KTR31_41610 [Myxococcales bacterium]|nr:hypothetical protein [Myxococcales bacterium]